MLMGIKRVVLVVGKERVTPEGTLFMPFDELHKLNESIKPLIVKEDFAESKVKGQEEPNPEKRTKVLSPSFLSPPLLLLFYPLLFFVIVFLLLVTFTSLLLYFFSSLLLLRLFFSFPIPIPIPNLKFDT